MKDAFGREVPDYDPDEQIAPMIIARVVDPQQWSPEYQRSWENLRTSNPQAFEQINRPYPGSSKDRCHACAVEVWIGPRQQIVLTRALENLIQVPIFCPVCIAVVAHAQNANFDDIKFRNLGNPWQRKV